ncbi:nitric oxide reductase activation protein NorD [Chloroflexota bacterium]
MERKFQVWASVELSHVREVLKQYGQALTGGDVAVVSASNLREKEMGWVSVETSTVAAATILLPELVEKYPAKEGNFSWYKVAVTHQVAHLEFGSFNLCLAEKASLFSGRCFQLAHQGKNGGALTGLGKFLSLFDDRNLALDIFAVVEDYRVDYLLSREYPGITEDYRKIQDDALSTRPSLISLPLREMFMEVMIRISLDGVRGFSVPSVLKFPLGLAGQILGRVRSPQATVADSAAATVRLYRLISRIPNKPVSADRWEIIDLSGGSDLPDVSAEFDINRLSASLTATETAELPYSVPQSVEYRGDFKLEMVRRFTIPGERNREEAEEISAPVSLPELETLTDKNGEFDELFASESVSAPGSFVFQRQGAGPAEELAVAEMGEGRGDGGDVGFQGEDIHSFCYDEWDFRASDYKPGWCRLSQRVLEEGTPDFFDETLRDYAGLVIRIRDEFERLNPQFFRKVKRLYDGQELDMDAVVDYVVAKKAGQVPNDKVYWRRNKTERDVAVVFLLDMSSSTIEYIDETSGGADHLFSARDYKGYLEWLQYHQENQGKSRAFKRIIDLEKESVVLLIKALETIGDIYAIYGFSGSGRENVEFYVIKDLEETFSEKIKRRIDSISPLNGTRMGPALRHAIWKLKQQPSRSKFLFLLSDGRPQDHGYGRDGLDNEYALNDTMMAFMEARQQSITPFCLTVDRRGHDYLRTMCCDMGYEVLTDVESLPERLPALYRKLAV